MRHSEQRILTTHAGSLVRPREIRVMLAAEEHGRPYDEAAYGATLRSEVGKVVRQQIEAGIDIPSDGEFGKVGWSSYVLERLDGLSPRELGPEEAPSIQGALTSQDRIDFADFYAAYEPVQRYDWERPENPLAPLVPVPEALRQVRWECTGPIRYKGQHAIQRDIANFRAALDGLVIEESFLPVAAPMSVEGGRANRFYPNADAYLADVAEAMRYEYEAIVDAGFILQIDDAFLPITFERMRGHSDAEVWKFAERRIEALNHSLSRIPPEKIRYHVCWGSWNGPHTSDVPLRTIMDLILMVNAQAYSIEAANPRHEHEWQVWQDVRLPDGKILIPGLVSHATNIVEHPELVSWRIQNFARLVGRENVIAGTDCGFCQSWKEIRVHPAIQWAKLRSLAEGAKLASSALWRT